MEDPILIPIITQIGVIISGFIAAYFGYKKAKQKSHDEIQTQLMASVNAQNSELRTYLSEKLKEEMEKHRVTIETFEAKMKMQEDEINLLKRDRERLMMKIFKLRVAMLKYGIEITDAELDELVDKPDGIGIKDERKD